MIPSEQRFGAGDRAVLKPDDWLEQNFDFAAVERAARVGLESETIRAQGAEHFDAISAHPLAMPHRDFGILQHVFARRVQLWIIEREADRGGERPGLAGRKTGRPWPGGATRNGTRDKLDDRQPGRLAFIEIPVAFAIVTLGKVDLGCKPEPKTARIIFAYKKGMPKKAKRYGFRMAAIGH